ncbi:hypothetical protein [Modestobacter sp. Leaf380]|uniref:hypothetical protein n=1 Tax=Modestobacter sp. Leaf380 TaxID=1736356 RepID=UPI0006F41B72|nr:hypothetical protein [Modestobacter sp. Leaf380]KQS66321.1 hypothetical protein ASG41_13510 [Modestobacter sp. Leaf380]
MDFGNVHDGDTALQLLRRVLSPADASRDDRNQRLTAIDDVVDLRRGLLAEVSSGVFGEAGYLQDADDPTKRIPIGLGDATMRPLRNLFVVPEFGTYGMIVAEARGRGTVLPGLIKYLNGVLPVYLRTDRDVVDASAWADELANSSVKGFELRSQHRSADGTPFVREQGVRRVNLSVSVEKNSELAERLSGAFRELRSGGERLSLSGLVHLDGINEDEFDEERILYSDGFGRPRSLVVSSDLPAFVYPFDPPDERPDDDAFLAEAKDTVERLAPNIDDMADLPDDWAGRPRTT